MSISEVVHALEQLNTLHEDLFELGERKKQVLIQNEVNELTKITNQESKLLKKVSEYEQQWLRSTENFVKQQGLQPSSDLTMSELIKLVYKVEQRQALQEAQNKLLHTIQKLHELNTLNQQLIEHSLSFIDYTIDLMTGDPSEDLLYHNPSEQVKGGKSKGIFDTRA